MLQIPQALLRRILIRPTLPLITLFALMSAVIALAPSPPALAGEGMAGLGTAFDYGGYDVPGFESGRGLTLEGGYYWTRGVGLFGCLHSAGYQSYGDADQIFWIAGEVRYRGYIGGDASTLPRWFWSAGAGGGVGYSGKPALVAPVLLEFGARLWRPWVLGFDLAVRNHAALFITGGDPPLDIINSIEFFVSIVGGVSN
jgi:hypothetical protein